MPPQRLQKKWQFHYYRITNVNFSVDLLSTPTNAQHIFINNILYIVSNPAETILKIHNTLVLPTFLYGSENWTLTASERWRIEAVEMKLLRPLAGYTLYHHKTNDYIHHELQITGILDKIDEYRWTWFQHLQRMPQNRIPLKSYYHRPQGRRTIGRLKKRREQL